MYMHYAEAFFNLVSCQRLLTFFLVLIGFQSGVLITRSAVSFVHTSMSLFWRYFVHLAVVFSLFFCWCGELWCTFSAFTLLPILSLKA